MKRTYIKPCTEVVTAENEAILIGVSNEEGNKIQLTKENHFIFDDSSEEDEL